MTENAADAKAVTAVKNTEATADAVAINKMKTAIVILNWNTEGFLKDFLPGLLHSVSKVKDAEVIVADNASTDGSLQVMKQMFPDVRTIALDRNYGFTGGYNKAFELIDSDLFVLINSDIEVTQDWLEPLVRWMEDHPECGACAPKLHSWQERDRFEYAGAAGGYIDRFGYPFCRGRIMGKIETDNGQYDSPSDVLWATGACLMVRSIPQSILQSSSVGKHLIFVNTNGKIITNIKLTIIFIPFANCIPSTRLTNNNINNTTHTIAWLI